MRKSNDWWEARRFNGCGGLAKTANSKEELKQVIDDANEGAVDNGYKAEQFFMVCIEKYNWYDEDGSWMRSETYESRVGIYPETL